MTDYAIQYRICPSHPEAHIFSISCVVNEPDPFGQRLSIPAWIPGSYMIRDFARNVISLKAEANGRPLEVVKLDKSTWQCAPCKTPIKLSYDIYAWDLSVRTAHLDQTHAYFNGTSVFLQIEGQEDKACGVEIQPPHGVVYQKWRVATAMKPAMAKPYGFGLYEAANYDELIDHPVEMGNFTLATFKAGGIPHDLVITGQHRGALY